MSGFVWQCQRILKNKWFYIAMVFTVGILWFEISSEADILWFGEPERKRELLESALQGEGNLLFLPLLSCLPGSAGIYQELHTGAARYRIFRCGYRSYWVGKLTGVLLSAILSQWMGVLVFQCIFSWLGGLWIPVPNILLVQRLAAAGIFSMLGNAGALLIKDTVSAYIFPVVLAFSLSMLQTRFFFALSWMNPAVWISGEGQILPFMAALFLGAVLLTALFTEYEVKKYA